jgi:hypothetical protein
VYQASRLITREEQSRRNNGLATQRGNLSPRGHVPDSRRRRGRRRPSLRVHGVQGLCVAVASVMSVIAATSINGAVITVAERAADLTCRLWIWRPCPVRLSGRSRRTWLATGNKGPQRNSSCVSVELVELSYERLAGELLVKQGLNMSASQIRHFVHDYKLPEHSHCNVVELGRICPAMSGCAAGISSGCACKRWCSARWISLFAAIWSLKNCSTAS